MVDSSPRRQLAAPFLASLSVCLWFLNREAGIRAARDAPVGWLVVAVLAAVALAGSYAVALLVAPRLPHPRSLPAPLRPLVAPANTTLAGVAAVSAGLGVYVFASLSFPTPLSTVASAVGVLLGWPVLLAVLASIVLSNAVAPGGFGSGPEFATVALGVAVSVLWWFVLVGGLVRLAGGDPTQPTA